MNEPTVPTREEYETVHKLSRELAQQMGDIIAPAMEAAEEKYGPGPDGGATAMTLFQLTLVHLVADIATWTITSMGLPAELRGAKWDSLKDILLTQLRDGLDIARGEELQIMAAFAAKRAAKESKATVQ